MSNKNNGVEPGNEPKKKVRIKRKRKEAFTNVDFLNKCQVPLSNRFEALNNDDDNVVDMEKKEKEKKDKISPIVVTTQNIDIQKIANDVKVECNIQIMSIGRKVFVQSINDKNRLKEAFTSQKIDFFTYADDANKSFKIILSGLPAIEIDLIVTELTTKHEITPTKVVMFNSTSAKKLYLCEFNKSEVNNKKLNIVHGICNHIIKWIPYKPKRKGPTQCQRCLMYGHGISSCNRFTVCAHCAGSHLTNTCTVNNEQTNKPVYKCFNCASNDLPHNHTANDESCPFRAKYIATMTSVRDKSKRGTKKNVHINNNTQATRRLVDAPAPPPLTSSFAHTTASRSNIQSNTQTFIPKASTSTTFNSFTPNHNTNAQTNKTNEPSLWSFSEVTQLLLSSINELKQCKSKMDQLAVIANLLQYACE